MADPIRVSGPVSGTDKTLTFETGKLAPQSQGAVVASHRGTTVLTTANAARDVRPGTDFFPLTVDVEERAYAAGKIPGSFFRREGRPTEDAILTCRLTDRPLRPSFPEGLPQRDPGRHHRDRRRPAEPARRAVDQRRVGRADDQRHPVRGPDRLRAHRLQHRRRVDPASDLRRGRSVRRSSSSSPGVSSTTATSPS